MDASGTNEVSTYRSFEIKDGQVLKFKSLARTPFAGEIHAEELALKAAAYLNVDVGVSPRGHRRVREATKHKQLSRDRGGVQSARGGVCDRMSLS